MSIGNIVAAALGAAVGTVAGTLLGVIVGVLCGGEMRRAGGQNHA